MALPVEQSRYTFANYLEWDESERTELIYGEPVMFATPSRIHQRISGGLFGQLWNYLDGKNCEVYAAPFAVRLFEQDGDKTEDVNTVVEPDISVVCDHKKLDKNGCKGAPDMVIEILSPSSRRHDRIVKLNLYQRAGVREYWIVNPEEKTVSVLVLDGNHLLPYDEYGQTDVIKVNVLDSCFIDLRKVFSE